MTFYKGILTYLEERFDFSDQNYLFYMQLFSLRQMFTFNELKSSILKLPALKNLIDMDGLYEEYCDIKDLLQKVIQSNSDTVSPIAIWNKILSDNKNLKLFLTIIQFVASIPPSNATCERIFSQCKQTWSDARNRLLPDTVKSELQIKTNIDVSCKEFYKITLSNNELLKSARSQTKYKFKNQNG